LKEFKAAIFDLDGTLIDSNSVWEKIDRKILSKRGIKVTNEQIVKMTAMTYEDAAEFMQSLGVKETVSELMSEFNELAVSEYRNSIFLKEYVKEYLDKLKNEGIKMAVATASPKILYEPVLRHNGIYSYFNAFCCTEEIGKSKDYPDIYLLAASRLNVMPEQCMVFEDVLKGVASAKNAGMYAVGVYDKYSSDDIVTIRSVADRFIQSFCEML
jgi:HAD superfamily hydrolase (TIGR01509 family)